MLGIQLGRDKYEKQKQKAQRVGAFLQEHTLVCVTDGARMTFLDDGPADPSRPPNPGRQKIIAAVSKRILVNGKKVPVFYALDEGAEVFDNAAGRPLEIPHYDDRAKALTEAFLEHRKAASIAGRAQWEGERKRYTKKGDA